MLSDKTRKIPSLFWEDRLTGWLTSCFITACHCQVGLKILVQNSPMRDLRFDELSEQQCPDRFPVLWPTTYPFSDWTEGKHTWANPHRAPGGQDFLPTWHIFVFLKVPPLMEHKLHEAGTGPRRLAAAALAPTDLPGTHKALRKYDDHPHPEGTQQVSQSHQWNLYLGALSQ